MWDAVDIPAHQMYNGHPAGSGMPLAWAHAEYVKLVRSVRDSTVYDRPPQTVERYQKQQVTADFQIWTEHAPRTWVSKGKHLRMDFNAQTTVQWSVDGVDQGAVSAMTPLLQRHILKLSLPADWSTLKVATVGEKHEHWKLHCCA